MRAQRTENSDPFQDAQSSKVRCPLWYSCASVRWQRQLRSELRPGATFDFKPVTREYADALRAVGLHVVSCYQYGKPVGRHRRISPVDTTATSRTLRPLCACTLRPGVRIRHRSSSASTRTYTSRPGKALQPSGFEESTRYWAWSAPVSMDTPGMCVGHRRWRNRALNHSRTPVGMANESVVAWKARTRRRALPERHRHRVTP